MDHFPKSAIWCIPPRCALQTCLLCQDYIPNTEAQPRELRDWHADSKLSFLANRDPRYSDLGYWLNKADCPIVLFMLLEQVWFALEPCHSAANLSRDKGTRSVFKRMILLWAQSPSSVVAGSRLNGLIFNEEMAMFLHFLVRLLQLTANNCLYACMYVYLCIYRVDIVVVSCWDIEFENTLYNLGMYGWHDFASLCLIQIKVVTRLKIQLAKFTKYDVRWLWPLNKRIFWQRNTLTLLLGGGGIWWKFEKYSILNVTPVLSCSGNQWNSVQRFWKRRYKTKAINRIISSC